MKATMKEEHSAVLFCISELEMVSFGDRVFGGIRAHLWRSPMHLWHGRVFGGGDGFRCWQRRGVPASSIVSVSELRVRASERERERERERETGGRCVWEVSDRVSDFTNLFFTFRNRSFSGPQKT